MKTRISRLSLALACVAGGLVPLSALAQTEAGGTPAVITYQGEARNAAGQPLQGAGEVRFELYDVQTGGVQKATAGPYAVTFADGRFTAEAVAFTPVAPATDAYGTGAEQRWLQISVRAPGAASFVTLTPRQRLTQTPFAKVATRALNVDAAGLSGTLSPSFVSGNSLLQLNTSQTITGAKTFNNAGNVFVGNGAGLTNVAASSYSGAIADGQLSSNVALLNRTNQVFAQNNIFNGNLGVGASTFGYRVEFNAPAGFINRSVSANTGGAWWSLQNTAAGGHEFNLISTGPNNGEGAGRLLIRDGTASAVRMTIDDIGRVGIGTTAPGAGTRPGEQFDRFEVAGPDVGLRIRNTNDSVGGVFWNSFGALHIGMYNPSPLTVGQIQTLDRRAFLSISNDGRVGSTTNTGGSPIFRNFLDDGNGNFIVRTNGSVQGQHVALFENTSNSTGDGIAIKINKASTNRENNFVTFLNGIDGVTGRIEGFDTQNGDWRPPPNFPDINFRPNISVRPTADWFDPGAIGTIGRTGQRDPSWVCNRSFTWNFAPGTSATWCVDNSWDPGSPGVLSPTGWRLPSANPLNILSIGNPPLTYTTPTTQDLSDLVCWGVQNAHPEYAVLRMLHRSLANLYESAVTICKDEGVTYGSKGADYAEFLERADHADHIRWGEVVGVKAGKVSRNTEGAEQVLVVSRAPIVLGNQPADGNASNYEKVAFMGQVPVLVRGKVRTGDYIVASGLSDGSAVAVPAENLSLAHLSKLVGRAWENSKADELNFINTAIGINQQAAQHVLAKQQKAVDANAAAIGTLKDENANLKARLERLEAMLQVIPEGR